MNTPNQEFAENLCKAVIESTNEHGVRSSKRTDVIHTKICSWIESLNPRVSCVIEERLKIATGTIDTDIVVRNKATQEIVACVSFKALMNNIGQNRTNNENVKCGEAIKITSAIPVHAKLVFLDIVPETSPYYTKGGSMTRMETNPPSEWKEREKKLMTMVNQRAELITDIYTLFPKYVWESRESMRFESMFDSADIDRMATFVEGLAPL
jgi:ribosomal protein L31